MEKTLFNSQGYGAYGICLFTARVQSGRIGHPYIYYFKARQECGRTLAPCFVELQYLARAKQEAAKVSVASS
jgi:hypothetical protein